MCPLIYSQPPWPYQVLGCQAEEDPSHSYTDGLPRTGHALECQAMEIEPTSSMAGISRRGHNLGYQTIEGMFPPIPWLASSGWTMSCGDRPVKLHPLFQG